METEDKVGKGEENLAGDDDGEGYKDKIKYNRKRKH